MALTPVFVVACALLVLAGAQKLRTPGPAHHSLALAGLPVPAVVVRLLGAGELAIGAIAAVWPTVLTGALVALAYVAFCAFLVLLLRRAGGASADCGCFGGTDAGATTAHVALNALPCVAGVLAATVHPPGLGWALTRPALVAVPLLLGTSAAVLAAYLAFTVFPRAWRAYGLGAEP